MVNYLKGIRSMSGNRRYTIVIGLIIILSASALIIVNYYSIKLLSATRAYISSESQYSKGQKNATNFLIQFLDTRKKSDYRSFKRELAIPIGDSLARVAMENSGSYEQIKEGFISGKNHSDDIDDMIWLFSHFKNFSYFNKAIAEWKAADFWIGQLHHNGKFLYKTSFERSLSSYERQIILRRINRIDKSLTVHQENFSEILGSATRIITSILMFTNITFIFLILLSAGLFARKMINQIVESKKQIEKQSHAKDEFMSIASHELKTPLTSMKASLQILERYAKGSEDSHKIHPFINNSNKQVDRLVDLVNELLDVTKIQQGKLLLNKSIVSVPQLINEAIAEVKDTSAHEYIIHDMPVAYVYTDKNRIHQVLINFLSNAAKYSATGTKIIVKAEMENSTIKVSVQDFGMGVPQNKIPMIFDRFYRVKETESVVQGLGLGLYICCEIIKNHNGDIGAKSEVGKGSTFWFNLPLAELKSA